MTTHYRDFRKTPLTEEETERPLFLIRRDGTRVIVRRAGIDPQYLDDNEAETLEV